MRAILNNCQKIELVAERIYRIFSQNDSYPEVLRGAFSRLGTDEAGHARQFDLLIMTEISEGDVSPAISADRVKDILSDAEKLLDEASKKSLTEKGALKRALKMEQDFLNVHVNNAVHFRNRDLSVFFENLGKEDEQHINYLKQLLDWWQYNRNKP